VGDRSIVCLIGRGEREGALDAGRESAICSQEKWTKGKCSSLSTEGEIRREHGRFHTNRLVVWALPRGGELREVRVGKSFLGV